MDLHAQHFAQFLAGRLADRFGAERVEQACMRARTLQSLSYRTIHSLLKTGLDKQSTPAPTQSLPLLEHENVRGPDYYN